MPAEHLKEEEEFDEDTLFDQAGLLTNQIKPRIDMCNVNGAMRITPMKTFALCLAFFGLGLSFAILEPTLLDLQQLAGTDVQKISYTITARALGYILGSALGILLFDRYNRQFLLFLSMLSMMVLLGVLPWCHNLVAYILLLFLLGILMQMLYAGGNVLCLDLWGKQSGPFLQAIHFSLALGVFLAPLLCNAIMMGNTGVSVPERPILLNFNSSQALALPASSLFGVHISSAGVYSRHRRQALYNSQDIQLNLTETFTKAAMLSVAVTGNKSGEYYNATNVSFPVQLNKTAFLTNATSSTIVNATSASENRMAVVTNTTTTETQVNTTMPSMNTSDTTLNTTITVKPSHKPKPSITDAKHLKKHPDPWARDPESKAAEPAPPPAPTVSTSTAQPTMVALLQTNGSFSNSNGTIINSTDVSLTTINGSSLIVNLTRAVASTVQTSSPNTTSIVTVTPAVGVNTVSTPPPSLVLNSSTAASNIPRNESQNTTLQLVAGKDNASNTSMDSIEKTRTPLLTTLLATSTIVPSTFSQSTTFNPVTAFDNVKPDNSKTLEASGIIHTTQQSDGAHLSIAPTDDDSKMPKFLKPELGTSLPTIDTFVVSEQQYTSNPDSLPQNNNEFQTVTSLASAMLADDNINEYTSSASKTVTDKIALVTTGLVPSGYIVSPQGSTESNVILSEQTSTMASNYVSIGSGGAVTDSSEDGPNITVHHKPSTFNNQSEDSPQLLNDLLNRISEMGVTKVHIVYVVMSVIVLLTSLVFLSFLCHNPRELRSKQEEGVKPGMQEGKFTSIMVGLMSVMIIFYTSAELVFSQLYLSLVWQSSAHLLRSRGSLLISVFWGLYAFSRGTSICCTNGFRPATMLLVDLVCCIVSAGTLAIFGSGVESLLWCSVAVMAIGLSSILPYSLLWLEEYIHISNKTACVLLMGGSVVNLVLSFMYGHPVTVSRSLVIYLVLTCCIFALLIFGIMWRLATWRGDKYGLNCKMDVRYQLASQVDEEEDSFELSSGNSSLYLLNNGNSQNGHTSWDSRTEPTMAYLPLKQKKTKWK